METRFDYQDFNEDEEGFDVFMVETGSNEYDWSIGVNNGCIYYLWPFSNGQKRVLVSVYFDAIHSILDSLDQISMIRLEAFGKHCPLLVQSLLDGTSGSLRLDRGALLQLNGKCALIKAVDFDFKYQLDKVGIDFVRDPLIIDTVNILLRRFTQIIQEVEGFDGFSVMEEVEITAKEILPGAKKGITIGRIIGTILG